ncbi:ribonuclease P protein component [Rhodomicrobium vannielii]|uniref:ribonuclease P protein component n=1 Tax=Rhodomicrobium vannielii TaxID=1069 RepID=UPI001AECA527|nr:ribonuclease P protein component [Rhodomicrobium vannielii]
MAQSFILQALPRTGAAEAGPARFGFAVGSKALTAKTPGSPAAKRAGAVMRNRARRRLKEAVRLTAPRFALSNYDYVVIGRMEALHQRFGDLLEDFQLAFGKLHPPPRADHAKPRTGRERKRSAGESQREIEET